MLRTHIKRSRTIAVQADATEDRRIIEESLAAGDMDGELVGLTEEFADEGILRHVIDGIGRADLFDDALIEDRHFIGEFQRFFLVVSDEHRGLSRALMQLAQPAA